MFDDLTVIPVFNNHKMTRKEPHEKQEHHSSAKFDSMS
jgi:hypothetical protein